MSLTDDVDGDFFEILPFVCPCFPGFPFDSSFLTSLGNDIFCESGISSVAEIFLPLVLHLDDPLWDGRQCHEQCCNNSPYFVKSLESTTDEELELRICNHSIIPGGNNLVEKVEIYVQ